MPTRTRRLKLCDPTRGGGLLSQDFKDYLSENRIVQNLNSPYTPQQMMYTEREMYIIGNMVQSLFNLLLYRYPFGIIALESAVSYSNMVPTKKVIRHHMKYAWQSPNLSLFKGYPKETMGYYFYFPPENKVIVLGMEIFLKEITVSQRIQWRIVWFSWELIPVSRSERTKRAPNRLCLNMEVKDDEVGDLREPANYKTAMLDPDKVIWQGAMDEEMKSMKVNKVWIVIDRPPNAKVVRSKWIFKKKTDMDGKVHTYKVLWFVMAALQNYGLNTVETWCNGAALGPRLRERKSNEDT
ncbi:retrotransposon protein, putative, ty1-copia subclass [Tanacetum coccineum]